MSDLKTACLPPFDVMQEHAWSSTAFILCGCETAQPDAYRHIVAKCENAESLHQMNCLANADAICATVNSHEALMSALADAVDVLDAVGRARHRSARMAELLPEVKSAADKGMAALQVARGKS